MSILRQITISAFLATAFLSLQAQTPADLFKLANPTVVVDLSNGLRSESPGSDCAHAIPLADGEYFFEPTTSSSINNIINTTGALSSCLGSAPNQTWFEFTASSNGTVQMFITGQQDYDFIFMDATDFPCEQFDSYDGSFNLPEILDCSYSASSNEEVNATLIAGRRYILVVTNFSNMADPFGLSINSNGIVTPYAARLVWGQIYSDVNDNCIFDEGDFPIQDARASLLGTIQYDISDSLGIYSLLLSPGQEGIISINTDTYFNLIWENLCPEQQPFVQLAAGAADTITANVAFTSLVDCALPTVSTSVPFLRRCFTSTRTLRYCNSGTIPAENVEITLRYDDGITPVSINAPYTFDGTYYRFQVGDLAIGACGNIYIVDSVGCENGIGSFGCVEAEISPIENCLSLPAEWDQSDLNVGSICIDSSSVNFTVTNAGAGNMSMAMPYQVKRNGQLEDSGTLSLNSGESQSFTYANSNDLVTFAITETPGNPFNINAWALGDCNSAINFGGTNPEYSIADGQPWLDIDCDIIIGAYDPNDKFAWPFGEGSNKRIDRSDKLEYRIRFQNTGNDTAFTIVVIDTISDKLNLETLRFTANSHPYTYEINDRVLTMRFDNIALPDSSSNMAGSIGYFRFMIDQMEDNPANYVVENFADIYFDFNPPIRTNTEYRSVGEVALNVEKAEINSFTLFPVPASDLVTIQLANKNNDELSTVRLFDVSGRFIQAQQFNGNQISISVSNLNSGIYFIEVIQADGYKNSKRLIVTKN
jgi:uncharacterized repeat protein (TIGR01451 family)